MPIVLFGLALLYSASGTNALAGAGTAVERQRVDAVDLDDLLARAESSARRYEEAIQDLTTEETYTILTYDDEGRVTQRRDFVSQFMVHRFTHGSSRMEYRHVLSVDGREAGDLELRVRNLTTALANASSESEERELIELESRKFGLVPVNRGFAMTTRRIFNQDDESFTATIAGRETVDGLDVILVEYMQISDSPRFRFSPRFCSPRCYVRGRLWLEASTGNVWREEGGWFVEGSSESSEDTAFIRYAFQHARSNYGVFTPERFEFISRFDTNRQSDFRPLERIIREFAPFERFGADVQFFFDDPVR